MWRKQHESAALELERLTGELQKREVQVASREHGLEGAEADLRQRGQQVVQLRTSLESWKARLATAAASWLGQRERIMADLSARERLLEEHAAAAQSTRERWTMRRRVYLTRVREERAAWQRMRDSYGAMRDQYWRKCQILDKQEHFLAERALALEQQRQEHIVQSSDAAATEKRLEVLRREWASLSARARLAVAHEWTLLTREADQLDIRARKILEDAEQQATGEKDLTAQVEAWEQHQDATRAERLKHNHEVVALRRQREALEMEVATAREEVERLARFMLDEAEQPNVPANQAA
jgi:chromosome segregation ATPase